MTEWSSQETDFARQCMLNVLVGKMLGAGSYRRVYEFPDDPTKVIKVEHSGKEFCNIHEWQVWEQVKDTPIEHWFAPCHQIDGMGMALIQSRTAPFATEPEFLKAVKELCGDSLPPFFDDAHHGNFGMMDGRVVCHDYGFTKFISHGVKVGWQHEQRKEERKKKRQKRK